MTTLKSPLIITDEYGQPKEVPAACYAVGVFRYLDVEPQWLNPGVIAHEQAHNAYALLTDQQKEDFAALYTPFITTDPLIKYLYSRNSYGLTSVIEGHAEIYRYLWDQIPEELKQFYPRLI